MSNPTSGTHASTPARVASRDDQGSDDDETPMPEYGSRQLKVGDEVFCQMPKGTREALGLQVNHRGIVKNLHQGKSILTILWDGNARARPTVVDRDWVRHHSNVATWSDYINADHPKIREASLRTSTASTPASEARARIIVSTPGRSLSVIGNPYRVPNTNDKSWMNALMQNMRRMSLHAGFRPTPLFMCQNDILRSDGLVLFLFAFMKMLDKWTDDRGINIYMPYARDLFNDQLMADFHQPNVTSDHPMFGPDKALTRLINLIHSHFFVTKEVSTNFYQHSMIFVSDSVWCVGTEEDRTVPRDQRAGAGMNAQDFQKISDLKKHERCYIRNMARECPMLYDSMSSVNKAFYEKGRRVQCHIKAGGWLKDSINAIDEFLHDFAQNSVHWPNVWKSEASTPPSVAAEAAVLEAQPPPLDASLYPSHTTVHVSAYQCLSDICHISRKRNKYATYGPDDIG